MDKALKLYLKAAEAAGNRDLVKRILSLREEDEDDAILTDESYTDENTENQPSNVHKTENMKVSDLDSKAEKGYNYSRKVPPGNEFATLAMQWAYSDKTTVGEQKLFYRKGKWVLLEKSDDGFVEMGAYDEDRRSIVSKEIKAYNEELYKQRDSQRREIEAIRESVMLYETDGRHDPRYSGDDGRKQTGYGRIGSIYQGESESNRVTDHEASKHDNRNQIKYSRKTDQDKSTLTNRNAPRDNERIWANPRTKEDYDEIIKTTSEKRVLGHSSYKIENASDSPASTNNSTEAGHITADTEEIIPQEFYFVNTNAILLQGIGRE